jgi:hypothetical protein
MICRLDAGLEKLVMHMYCLVVSVNKVINFSWLPIFCLAKDAA